MTKSSFNKPKLLIGLFEPGAQPKLMQSWPRRNLSRHDFYFSGPYTFEFGDMPHYRRGRPLRLPNPSSLPPRRRDSFGPVGHFRPAYDRRRFSAALAGGRGNR